MLKLRDNRMFIYLKYLFKYLKLYSDFLFDVVIWLS